MTGKPTLAMQHGTPFSLRTAQQPATGADQANVVPASDAFVISTLCFLWFLIGCFVMWAFLLWRRQKTLPPHKKLLMELEAGDHAPSASPPSDRGREDHTPPAPWEKPADWWKK